MSFTRAIEIEAGDVSSSRHQHSLALAANDRMRFASDFVWRYAWAKHNAARLVRNPDAGGTLFPAEHELLSYYQHFKPSSGYTWPVTGPGEPEGANLGSVIPQFIYGNPETTDEPDRLYSVFPSQIDGHSPTNALEQFQLGSLQRGAITSDGSVQYVPAFQAAQTCLAFYFHPLLWHGKSYGGWQPTPPLDAGHPYCDDSISGEYYRWPNHTHYWTALDAGVSTEGLHGSVSTVGGVPRVTYAGSCPCTAPNSASGHVIGIYAGPLAWYVYVWDGTTDGDGNCVVNVDRLPTSDWAFGPYENAPQLQHQDWPGILRTVWAYGNTFKGSDTQRENHDFQITQVAFDAQSFFTTQYPLAPARGVMVEGTLTAVYPNAVTAADGTFPLQDEAGNWAPHSGFTIAGFCAYATGLSGPVTVTFKDGAETLTELTLTPDETGAASALTWVRSASPATLSVVVSGITTGTVFAVAAELQEYLPQDWDRYLVLRFATANGVGDPVGQDYSQAQTIVASLLSTGCLVGQDPAPQADAINGNPLYEAFRQASRTVRVALRDSLLSYEIADGVARLRFRRALTGIDLADADPWEGIAPPPNAIASGELVTGETYIVRGTSGTVTHAGVATGIGSTFTATGTDYTATGDAAPWVEDGIRHAALPQGWSNEWVFILQMHPYMESETSIWKPSVFADFFLFHDRAHFYNPSSTDEFRAFANATYSFSVDGDTGETTLQPVLVQATWINPEAPSAFTYSSGSNSGASNNFQKSCQVYHAPYEIDSCTLEFDGDEQIVVLTLNERLHAHENAPSSVAQDPLTWSADDLARLAGTAETDNEDYRTDDNAVRGYIRKAYGDGDNCERKVGDSGYGSVPFPTVHGSCYVKFIFAKLVPLCYEDGNETLEVSHDSRTLAEMHGHAEEILSTMCEAFVAGEVSAEKTCARAEDAGLYDWTYPDLCVRTFGDRSVSAFPESVRSDRPHGFGPMPRTYLYAEVHNRLAQAYNELTKLRIDLPLTFEVRQLTYRGEASVTPDPSWFGACTDAAWWAWADSVSPPAANTLIADTDWVEWATPPQLLAGNSLYLECCDGSTDWCAVTTRITSELRVRITVGWENALPAHVASLIAAEGLHTLAVSTILKEHYQRLDDEPRAECDGVPLPWRYDRVGEIDNEQTCEPIASGDVVSLGAPTAGDLATRKPAGSDACNWGSVHLGTWDLLAYPGAYVEVPLVDMP